MRITDIDPLEFKLLFERFLNPERVSMPDFDVDFCMNRRGEVIQYVAEKYGKERVGQIATFHQLKARGVIRDIARAMEIPFGEADKLAKLVPEPVAGKSPPVREAIEQTPELKQLYNESPLHRELLDLAASLEGLNRNAGMHAAWAPHEPELQPVWLPPTQLSCQSGEHRSSHRALPVMMAAVRAGAGVAFAFAFAWVTPKSAQSCAAQRNME